MCSGPAFLSFVVSFTTSYNQQLQQYSTQKRAVDRHNKVLHRNFLSELQIVQQKDRVNENVYNERLKARKNDVEAFYRGKDLNQLAATLADTSNQLTFKERVQKGLFDMQDQLIKNLQDRGKIAASGIQPGQSLSAILDDSLRQFGFAEAMIGESFDSSKTQLAMSHYRSSLGQSSADTASWNDISPVPPEQPIPGLQPNKPIYEEDPDPPNVMSSLFDAAMSAMMTAAFSGAGGAATPPVGETVTTSAAATSAAGSNALLAQQVQPQHIVNAQVGMAANRGSLALRTHALNLGNIQSWNTTANLARGSTNLFGTGVRSGITTTPGVRTGWVRKGAGGIYSQFVEPGFKGDLLPGQVPTDVLSGTIGNDRVFAFNTEQQAIKFADKFNIKTPISELEFNIKQALNSPNIHDVNAMNASRLSTSQQEYLKSINIETHERIELGGRGARTPRVEFRPRRMVDLSSDTLTKLSDHMGLGTKHILAPPPVQNYAGRWGIQIPKSMDLGKLNPMFSGSPGLTTKIAGASISPINVPQSFWDLPKGFYSQGLFNWQTGWSAY